VRRLSPALAVDRGYTRLCQQGTNKFHLRALKKFILWLWVLKSARELVAWAGRNSASRQSGRCSSMDEYKANGKQVYERVRKRRPFWRRRRFRNKLRVLLPPIVVLVGALLIFIIWKSMAA